MRLALLGVALVTVTALVSCATADPNATMVTDFDTYESWLQVNTVPIAGDATGTLGRAVHEGEAGFRDVFVNAVGEAASTGAASLPYPVGTIFVKNSYPAKDGRMADLSGVTVMVKRDARYDADNGDWEYINLNASLDIRGQGTISGCISCHSVATDRDYIFGGYE